jgi:hypothetical protein
LYYLVKVIVRYIIPLFFSHYINRRMNDFSDRNHTQQQYNRRKKEGEVTIDTSNTRSSSAKRKDQGEYVEYEEIRN